MKLKKKEFTNIIQLSGFIIIWCTFDVLSHKEEVLAGTINLADGEITNLNLNRNSIKLPNLPS